MTGPAAREVPHDPKYDDYDFPTTSPTVQSGHPGHTTPEQDAQIFQLRGLLEQAGYTKNLDTLTLVCSRPCLCNTLQVLNISSCDSSARASSMLSSPRRCKPEQSYYRCMSCILTASGSSTARSGGPSTLVLVSKSWSALSTTRRSQRSSSTTHNTTTRPTRYELPHSILKFSH